MNDGGAGPPAAVVFDVDGTLYRQRGLRLRMTADLAVAAAVSRRARGDLRILKRFRADRETLADKVDRGFETAQYAVAAEALGLPPDRVREAVRRWIHERPLRYLARHRVPGLLEWWELLRGRGVRLGVYSEYPAEEKLRALGLRADAVAASTDPGVDAFKPDPKGIRVVLERLGASPGRALYVGDRADRDRPCAEAAGVAFLHVGPRSAPPLRRYPPDPDRLPPFLREILLS